MDTKLTPMSQLPFAVTSSVAPVAACHGTAVSAAVAGAFAAGSALGIDVPGPPRGAPV